MHKGRCQTTPGNKDRSSQFEGTHAMLTPSHIHPGGCLWDGWWAKQKGCVKLSSSSSMLSQNGMMHCVLCCSVIVSVVLCFCLFGVTNTTTLFPFPCLFYINVSCPLPSPSTTNVDLKGMEERRGSWGQKELDDT